MDDIHSSNAGSFKDLKMTQPVLIDSISQCLTEKHEDCLGAYVNSVLGWKLTCLCSCHLRTAPPDGTGAVIFQGKELEETGDAIQANSIEVAQECRIGHELRDRVKKD